LAETPHRDSGVDLPRVGWLQHEQYEIILVAHYYRERNHQGLGNELIDGAGVQPQNGVRRRQRLVASSVITIEPRCSDGPSCQTELLDITLSALRADARSRAAIADNWVENATGLDGTEQPDAGLILV
jgi:hypothetical protein